ncbi:GNAT family N-acetyltransferase [Kitasatospora sp. NPDC087861]|uniref:GNAT family N-acetyltransferase n=1 Tax=Kitasatospora sp. NPDC087861 TaxID=3364070 RepID=UPI0038254CEC
MQDPSINELVRMWIAGWTVSRGAAEPVDEPWGWTIDVGAVGHVARHVLPEPTEADVRKIAETTTAPGTWLKLFTEDAVARSWLGPQWRLDAPGHLMSAPLAAERPKVPAGYTVTTWSRGGVVRTLVRTGAGHLAARGQAGLAGTVAVPDQILTAPGHQRRGLGSLVMRTLQHAGREAGADTGVLVATPDGQALYTSLGWATRSPMASLAFEPTADHPETEHPATDRPESDRPESDHPEADQR